MASQEGFSSNKAPLFNGANYGFWSKRMKTYFMAFGFDVWKSVVYGNNSPDNPPTNQAGKKSSEQNDKAIDSGCSNTFPRMKIMLSPWKNKKEDV